MNKYDKVMNKINVTPEMHDRIMKNIQESDLKAAPKKVYAFQDYKKYLSIAACLMVCVAGMLVVPNFINLQQEPPDQVVSEITTCGSKDELSANVGFKVKGVEDIPFEVKQIVYISHWREMAEISYQGSEDVMTFRMSAAQEDISGDYTSYEKEKSYDIEGYKVTLKGNDNLYNLAIWHDSQYSYALKLERAVKEEAIVQIVQSVK